MVISINDFNQILIFEVKVKHKYKLPQETKFFIENEKEFIKKFDLYLIKMAWNILKTILKKCKKYIYNKKLCFLGASYTYIWLIYKNKSFIKIINGAYQPLFGLVNTMKHFENIFDENIFFIFYFSKSYSFSHQSIKIMILFFSNLQACLYNLWKNVNGIFAIVFSHINT